MKSITRFAITLFLVYIGATMSVQAAPNINNQEPKQQAIVETKTQVTEPTVANTPNETVAVVETPATAPETVQTQPTYEVGCEQYRSLISQYDWNVDVAMAIMQAESGCNTYAIGDQRVLGGIYAPSCGLMQIRTLEGRPSCEALHDPATNILWAYRLYSSSGWGNWSVCKTVVACY